MSLNLSLLLLGVNLIIGIQGACEDLISSGDCDFYSQCLGDDIASDADSVLSAETHCARLAEYYEDFDDQGKEWNLGVRACVMTFIYEATNPSYSSFMDFEELLLHATASCNLNLEPSLCDIVDTNSAPLSTLYQYQEDSENPAYWDIMSEQMIENLLTCVAKHPLYSANSDGGQVYCHQSAVAIDTDDLAAQRTGANVVIDAILESLQKGFTSESDSSSPSSACLTMAEEGNCEFFTECLDSEVECYDQGYALNEGYKFCKKLAEKQPLFKQDGQFWAQNTRECLTKEMLALMYGSLSCDYIRSAGLKSLMSCVHGNLMCRVVENDHNVFALSEVTTLAQADFFGRNRRRYGLQLETVVTDSMRACYGFEVLPYCLRLIEDGALTVKTKADGVEIAPEDGFEDGDGKPASWKSSDMNCQCAGGQCQLNIGGGNSCSGGQFVTGKCDGDANRQCCVPDTTDADTCIDSSFLCREEGFSTVGYVPQTTEGSVYGERGVTLALSVDLANKDQSHLEGLGLDTDIVDLLLPYFGLKGNEALEALNKDSLVLSVSQAMTLSALVETQHLEYIKQLYDDEVAALATPTLKTFEELTLAQRTVIASVFYDLGDPETCCADLWLQFLNQDWETAKSLLRNFEADSSCVVGENTSRRCREAQLLEDDDSSGQNSSC